VQAEAVPCRQPTRLRSDASGRLTSQANCLLDGTLYARYYDLPVPHAWPATLPSSGNPSAGIAGR
jgi:hypothetical protein